jgi:hypothetical protein
MTRERTKEKPSKRQLMYERQRKSRMMNRLVWGGAGIAVLALVGLVIWQSSRTGTAAAQAMGEIIPVNSTEHIPEGTDPGPYPSDPPAGGVHYESTLPAKLYQEQDLATLGQFPQGYLVHNLEHGHVIFWYNCAVLDEAGCQQLKSQLQDVLDVFDGVKVVAFPWKSLDVPVVATSWGRLQRFESFDTDLAERFVRSNRNKAPEPEAP